MRITPDQLFVLGLTAVTVVALHLFLQRSTLGRAMRATSLNPQLARVAGIDPERVLRATWVIGGVLAAVAGVFAGLTVQLRPDPRAGPAAAAVCRRHPGRHRHRSGARCSAG